MLQVKKDPMAPENLPKGMKLPEVPEKEKISQKTRNYSGEILAALDNIDGLDLKCMHMEVTEDYDNDPVVSLVISVGLK